MGDIIKYIHHGVSVSVDESLKGKHRDHCLCYRCKKFYPDDIKTNCSIARSVFDCCVKFNITTPVYECPLWENKKDGNE